MKATHCASAIIAILTILGLATTPATPTVMAPVPKAPTPPQAAKAPVRPEPAKPVEKPPTDRFPVLATAYSSGSACNGEWAGRNAVGGRLKAGAVNSAAADWSRFPVGTKFRVVETGKVYVVDDYGSAMVGRNKVDLFMPDAGKMRRWGRRTVTVEILHWGCHEESLRILQTRSRMPHIRQMVQALRDRIEDAG